MPVNHRPHLPGPLWRRGLAFPRHRPVAFAVLVLAVALTTLARSTPSLIVDASTDRAFTAEIDAVPERAARSQRLDLRAYATSVTSTDTLDAIGDAIDDVPVYGDAVTSLIPIGYRTARPQPTPVVRLAGRPAVTAAAVLYARSDALPALVPVDGSLSTESTAADGVWLPDTVAGALGASVGDAVELELMAPSSAATSSASSADERRIATATVAGVYVTDDGLPRRADGVITSWSALAPDLPDQPTVPGRPAALIVGSIPAVLDLADQIGETLLVTWDAAWEGPRTIEHGRTAADAVGSTARRFRDPQDRLGRITEDADIAPVVVVSGVADLVDRAEETATRLRPIIESTARGTQIVAIGLVLVAAWLHLRRRSGEVALLVGEGVRSSTIGLLATWEQLSAAVLGVGFGWVGGRWLGDRLAASGDIGATALADADRAAWTTAPIVIGGVLIASTIAAWAAEPARAGWAGRLAAALQWEVLATVVALAAGAQLVTQDGPALSSGAALVFPIAAIIAAAGIAARVLAVLAGRLGRSRRVPAGPPRHLAWWLARHRLVHALADASALVVVAAAGAGLLVHSGSFAASATSGTNDKAAALAGARSTLSIPWSGTLNGDADGIPTDLAPRWSIVWRDSDVSAAPKLVVDLLAVDRDTFARAAAWRDAFADRPLDDVLDDLAARTPGRIGIVVAGSRADRVPDSGTLTIGAWSAAYEVVDRIRAAPGQRDLVPMVMVDARNLFALIPTEDPTTRETVRVDDPDGWFRTELWSSESPSEMTATLADRDIELTDETVAVEGIARAERTPAIVAFRSAIPYLRAIGVVALVLACAALAQHASRRREAAAAETAMLTQMGVSAATLRWSAVGELVLVGVLGSVLGTGLGAATNTFMVGRMDPLPRVEPGFATLLSWPSVAVAVGSIAAVAAVVALGAHRSARRADVGEVLRVSS